MPKILSKGGNKLSQIMRFVQKQPGGCWIWTGKTTHGPRQEKKPYGVVAYKGRMTLVRRAVYELWGCQPPLEGYCVDSKCNNSLCVRPEHLVKSQRKKSNGPSSRGGPGGTRHPRFPWDDWFKKPSFRLTRGKDYSCKPHCMAQMVRNRAGIVGVRVSIGISEDGQIDVTVWGRKDATDNQ